MCFRIQSIADKTVSFPFASSLKLASSRSKICRVLHSKEDVNRPKGDTSRYGYTRDHKEAFFAVFGSGLAWEIS